MQSKNKTNLIITALTVLIFVLGCSLFKTESQPVSVSNSTASQPVNTATPEAKTDLSTDSSVEKPDFTTTSEELDKEYTDKDATREKLEKYAGKTIRVTGRVNMIITKKNGNLQPYVTMYAPGIMHGVSCSFDDENVEQMKLLTKDKMTTIQGFQNNFVVPKVYPRLDHCIVIKGS